MARRRSNPGGFFLFRNGLAAGLNLPSKGPLLITAMAVAGT